MRRVPADGEQGRSARETTINVRQRKGVRGNGRAAVDLAALVSICTLGAALSTQFEVVDRIVAGAHSAGIDDANGLVALAVLAPLAVAVYAVRRYRDAIAVRSELARISLLDNLTGLPNRLFLSEWLDGELRRTRRAEDHLALLFIDLDRFKVINDTHGHDVGDAVLITIAARIRRCLDDDCKLVRYAGDEFLAFCREDTLSPRSERSALRIHEALKEPVRIGTDVLRITASIGIAHHQDGDTADELIRKADLAMYDAKARDDGLPVRFDPTRHGDRFSPATLEPILRHAAYQKQFRLVYQPVADIVSGEIVAVETLLRWDHPSRGPVPPSEFIPVLEESGLIVGVGEWIIEEAFRQAREWHQAFPDRVPLRVAINVSARQLAQSGFDDKVRQALAVHPVPPASICLEITEGALMVDIEAAWSALRSLKRLGIKLALDDFGTGYSSLSYLRRFSLDMLKIDQSFVRGMNESQEDAAIVKHVIAMARALGMVTVAEGIEQPEQLSALHRLGCDLAQGFLMSKPVPADDITRILRQGGHMARPFGGVEEPRHQVPVNPFDRIDITAPVSAADLLPQSAVTATGEPPLAAER